MESFLWKTQMVHSLRMCQAEEGRDWDTKEPGAAFVLLSSLRWFTNHEATGESVSQSLCGDQLNYCALGLGCIKFYFRKDQSKQSLHSLPRTRHNSILWAVFGRHFPKELLVLSVVVRMTLPSGESLPATLQIIQTFCQAQLNFFPRRPHSLYLTIDQQGCSVPVYRLFCTAI